MKSRYVVSFFTLMTLVFFGVFPAVASAGNELPVVEAVKAYAPNVPPPITRKTPALVKVTIHVVEKDVEIAPGVIYHAWTFDGHIPGPFIRVREGDVLEIHLKNEKSSRNTHTIDFHAVTGPGGAAPILMTEPGEESVIRVKALKAGLFIYHCAANPVPVHIANGLYGLVLVEPKEGLRPVDREYYVMQSEFYTEGKRGEKGTFGLSTAKAFDEEPTYVIFNGRVGSLVGEGVLKAKVGETVRLFVGNIGPNLVSSFHVIGEIFDNVFREGTLVNPDHNIQTTVIPAGSASTVEFHVEVPGKYTLVDHSIFRIMKGAAGFLMVEGPEAPDIYKKIK